MTALSAAERTTSLEPPSAIADLGWAIETVGKSAPPVRGEVVFEQPGIQIRALTGIAERFQVTFPYQARFTLDFDRQFLTLDPAPYADPAILSHLLGNQILPRILAHQGETVIHAAAVSDEDATLLIVGPTGSGKSTLAASFYANGHDLLGDDATSIGIAGNRAIARSVYQSLRLYPDSLAQTLPEHRQSRLIAGHSSKRDVFDLDPAGDRTDHFVRGIVFLHPTPSTGVRVERITNVEACFALMEHCFRLDPKDVERLKAQIAACSDIVLRCPAIRMGYPRDYSALTDVRTQIAAAFGLASQ